MSLVKTPQTILKFVLHEQGTVGGHVTDILPWYEG